MKSRDFKGNFFRDKYIHKLSPIDKLLFIYYVWNESTNLIGTYLDSGGDDDAIYYVGQGVTQDDLDKFKAKMEADKKIYFIGEYVLIRNFEKHVKYMGNKQMMSSCLKQFKELPDDIKIHFLKLKPEEVIKKYDNMFYEELKDKSFRRLLATINLDYCVNEMVSASL